MAAYVPTPRDLSKVKSKILFNLTKRQLLCFGAAALVGLPVFFVLKATGNAGRVITMGFAVAPTEVNQFLITSKELDVRGSRLQNKKFQKAIDLIKEGKLDLSGTVSHTYPFEKAQEAFDFEDSKDPSMRKVVLTFEG